MESSHSYRPEGLSGAWEQPRVPSRALVRVAVALLLLVVFATLTHSRLGPPIDLRFGVIVLLGAGLYLPALIESERRVALWFALFVTPAAWVSFVVFTPGGPLELIAGVCCVAGGLLLGVRTLVPDRPRAVKVLTVVAISVVVAGVGLNYTFLATVFAAAEMVA